MNDAIALLAISQLVCLGALFYLYSQLIELKKGAPAARRKPSTRIHRIPGATDIGQSQHAAARAARAAYTGPVARPQPARAELAALVARANGAVDVSALARRMRKSEEEVRILLRRQGIAG